MTEETFRIPSIDGDHSTRSNWNVFGIQKEEFTFFAPVARFTSFASRVLSICRSETETAIFGLRY